MVDYTEFKKTFKGDIIEPESPKYTAAIARWAANAVRKARYVVYPTDEEDIALALKFAISNAIPVAIKCGGHNPSGVSSVENGLCIDLVPYLNTTKVDPDNQLAYVGGGALWETVDNAAIEHGLAVVGGTVNTTGVGGLTLAGGYGWLLGRHGLVIDNLVQMTVVTANGSVIIASEISHPELFWGLRGGGSNFGVVTEFVFKLHPQRKTVFAGPVVFPPPMLTKVVEVIDNWWPNIDADEAIMMGFTRGPPPEMQPVIVLYLFFNGSEEEGRANFKRLYDLAPIADMAKELPYEEVNTLLNDKAPHGAKYYVGGTSLRSKICTHALELFHQVTSMTANHPNPKSNLPPYRILVMYELASLNKVCTVPPDATAFRSRGPQANIVVLVTWEQEDEEGEGVQYAGGFVKEVLKIIDSTAERPPKENENETYSNLVTDMSAMPEKVPHIWGDNYIRLQKLKKEYDPDMIFNRWFPIKPSD